MARMWMVTGVALIALASTATAAPKLLKLPDSETAVAMSAPVLPVKIAGGCPSSDPCEFGTNWRVCEDLPVYSEARDGAPLVRTIKADETFVAEGGEIELTAPGEVVMLLPSAPEQTGGMVLQPGLKLLAYGPMPNARALYFDPASGKGWSPEAAADSFWWDDKIAKLTRAPEITWWLKAKLSEGAVGWMKLKSIPDVLNFPMFSTAEALQSWNVDQIRDDESPDCAGMLEITRRHKKK